MSEKKTKNPADTQTSDANITIEEIPEEAPPSPTQKRLRAAGGFALIIVLLAVAAAAAAAYFIAPDTGLAGTVKTTVLYALILVVGIAVTAFAYKVFREKFSYFATIALIGICISVVGCALFLNGTRALISGTQTVTTISYEVKTKGLGERAPDFYIELQKNGDTTEITIDEDMYDMLCEGSGRIALEYYPYVNIAVNVEFLSTN